jgi:hypothetical protein
VRVALHAVIEFELCAHLEHFSLFGITKELKVGLITITITSSPSQSPTPQPAALA